MKPYEATSSSPACRAYSVFGYELTAPEASSASFTYRQQRDLIAVGAYQKGSDPQVDHAITMWPRLRDFLQQEVDAPTTLVESIAGLEMLTAGGVP